MEKKKTIKTLTVIFSILMLGILVNMEAYAAIVCVDQMEPSCHNTIQNGIDAAVSGDTVEVASGTYVEQVTLKGGITLQGENRQTTTIWNNNDTVVSIGGSNISIQGFTIISVAGNAIEVTRSEAGGGTFNFAIRDNIITDSASGIYMYAYRANIVASVTNSIIKNNGTGIYYRTGFAGGIRGDIWNNIIINNTGTGILLYAGGSNPNVVNNVIYENSVDGIKTIGSGSAPYFSNNIIMSNGNYGITNDNMTPTVAFNDVYNNTAGNYDNVIVGPGSISVDPEFVDAIGKDFHLLPSSPVIDAGNPANAPLDDMDGDPRPLDGDANSTSIHDMGADEYAGCADRDSDSDGIFDDGNCNGITGDNPCTGGNTENCDDNCVYTSNPDQEDVDENGIGDACEECIILGDINEDEIIDISDVILVLRMALELDPYKYICKYLWCPE